MKTKLEYAVINLEQLNGILQCPLCKENLIYDLNSVKCDNNHTFNLNKKGMIALADPISDKLYNKEMFTARNHILQSDIYSPVYEYLKTLIHDDSIVVDAGCGEGTYLDKVYKPSNRHIGLDLAKEGLNIATNYNHALWLLADLAKIPIQDETVDYILNILSPANYEQFDRILKDDGRLIKVIVNKDYLKELRAEVDLETHNNTNVHDILERNFDIISKKVIKYTIPVEENLQDSLIKMTPLTKNHDDIQKVSEITIDVTVVEARKR